MAMFLRASMILLTALLIGNESALAQARFLPTPESHEKNSGLSGSESRHPPLSGSSGLLEENATGVLPGHFPFMGRVTDDRVHVRAGMNENYESLSVLDMGEELVVLGKKYDWYLVKVPPKTRAFVHKGYVKEVGQYVGVITGDKLNVRCRPDAKATVLGQLEKGARVQIKDIDGDWFEIAPTDELTGWVHGEYVEGLPGARVPQKIYSQPELLGGTKVVATAPVPSNTPNPKVEKPFLLTDLGEGTFEAVGQLVREGGSYMLTRGANIVCLIEGPSVVLDPFLNAQVRVEGKRESSAGLSDPLLSLTKIRFDI